MAVVVISGGTGLVGQHLSRKLEEKGYEVVIMSRSKPEGVNAIGTADFIIHLAGENISGRRWTARQKRRILDSRVHTAHQIYEHVVAAPQLSNLKAFISASATGYYGAVTTEKIFTEEDPAATDFLGETCKRWEASADRFQAV